jgi:hypothetical protein
VCSGIVALLEVDRYDEELERWKHEWSNKQTWFVAEWDAVAHTHWDVQGMHGCTARQETLD